MTRDAPAGTARDGKGDQRPAVGAAPGGQRERGLLALYVANGISALGTRMSFLAVPWFVLTSTGRAVDAGLVGFAEMAPYVAVQALGGPAVDRLGVRRTSITTDLLATVTVGLVPVLHLMHALPLPLLATLLGLAGAARGAGDTARDVLVPVLADRSGTPLERAAGVADGASRLAGLIGAPVAGVLISATSPLTVLAVDAATFAASAAVVLGGIRPVQAHAGEPVESLDEAAPSYLRSLRAGFRFLCSDRLLLGIAAMILVTNTLDQAQATVLTPTWATRIAGSSLALGLVAGGFSAGAVTGNLLLSWLGPRLPRRLTYGIGFLLAGAPRYLAMALCSTVPPVLAVAVVAGVGAGSLNPVLGAVQYERIPRPMQPRVLGALGAIAWAGIPIGSLAGGTLTDHLDLRPTLLLAGATYFVTTLAPFVFPAWRGMNRNPLIGTDFPTGPVIDPDRRASPGPTMPRCSLLRGSGPGRCRHSGAKKKSPVPNQGQPARVSTT